MLGDMRSTIVGIATALLVLVHVSLRAQGPSLPTEFIQQPFDVQRYDVAAYVNDISSKFILGQCVITVNWIADSPAATFPFHLRSLIIDSVVVRKTHLTVTDVGKPSDATYHHEISLGARNAGQADTIRIHYHGTMTQELGTGQWGGVQYQDSVLYAMGVGLRNNYVSATQHWMPCYDHPSDKATLHTTFFTPVNIRVASNGVLQRDTILIGTPSNVRMTQWEESHDCATYLMTFVAAPYAVLDFGADPVPMQVYSLRRDTTATRKSFRYLPSMVSLLQQRFTPYPFDKVGYANTTRGSMEHQTMICFALSISQSGDTVNKTAAHELAHQWFGDLVTPIDFRHAWLTESFATYSESLWHEHLFGTTGYQVLEGGKAKDYMLRIAKTSGIGKHEGVFPIYDFPRATTSNYPETIYQKGAVVLGMLRALMGEDVFFEGLRRYLNAHAYGTAATSDLVTALDVNTSIDVTSYITEWIYGKGWAKLRVEFQPGATSTRVRISQVQHDLDTSWTLYSQLPLNCTFTDAGGAQRDSLFVFSGTTTLEFDVASAASLKINEGMQCRSLVEVVQTTSVDRETPTTSYAVSVAPNPAHTSFTLTRSSATERCTVDVVTVLGASCYHATWDAGSTTLLVPASVCTSGSHIVVIQSASRRTSLPLLLTPSW